MESPARHHVDDRSYIDRRVEAVDETQLEGPTRSALRDPAARITSWRREQIAYDFLNPSSGGIYRFAGTAEGRAGEEAWSLVLKVTRAAESLEHEPPLPPDMVETMIDAVRWDRELHAYESGFLARLDGGFVAPAYHGGFRNDDETCWLWLEDAGPGDGSWPLERWALVGRELGAFNGAYLTAGDVPSDGWLGRQWLRTWVTRITPYNWAPALGPDPIWQHPLVRDVYPAKLRECLWAVWADRERLLGAVEALPRTCCHLDAHRRNLFIRSTGRGEQIVAVDWGLLGLAPPGEEIASTLVGTIASGEAPVEDAPAFAALVYDGYLDGLRSAGWSGDERDIRLAFTAAAGLRALSILGLRVADDPERSADEAAAALARSAALARFLVGLGDEARALCA